MGGVRNQAVSGGAEPSCFRGFSRIGKYGSVIGVFYLPEVRQTATVIREPRFQFQERNYSERPIIHNLG